MGQPDAENLGGFGERSGSAGYPIVMPKGKMKKDVENLVYLSQIGPHDIFLYSGQAILALEWLTVNGHVVSSWEAYLETKEGIARTLRFGFKTESPFRCLGEGAASIREGIRAAIEEWSKTSKGSRLIICLNLRDALSLRPRLISPLFRVAAVLLAFCSLGLLGLFSYEFISSGSLPEGIDWSGPVAAMICATLFLYAAVTGKGDLHFLSPENFFRRRVRRRIMTETGQLRWTENA